MFNILICDDDRDIAAAIAVYLGNEGYKVHQAYNGKQALAVLEEHDIRLIIMDIMMPELDGLSATMEIRRDRNIPIIMLSAKSEDTDKIIGLSAGADDYITKPFNPLELIARVKSQLRRYVALGSIEKKAASFRTGGMEIDDEQKTVTLDGEQIVVTPIEYGILRLLTENAGKVFSIDQIYEAVWKEPAFNPENTVAVHVRRIREKIEINPKEPKYLKVVWGIGYKIEKIK